MKRLLNLIKGFFGLFVSGLEKNNPEALLELEKENMRKQIASFNNGLAEHAGLVESLAAQAKKLDAEENDLRLKVKALIQAGKRELAGQLAVRLDAIDKEHDEVLERLTTSEQKYKELTKARDLSVKGAKEKMEKLSRDIKGMKMDTAAANLTEMANGMISQIGTGADNMNRISEIVDAERNKAAGRLRVAKDSADFSQIAEMEAADHTMAEIALAQFEAEMGIASPSVSSAPVSKVMG
jgi:phage shock protein A